MWLGWSEACYISFLVHFSGANTTNSPSRRRAKKNAKLEMNTCYFWISVFLQETPMMSGSVPLQLSILSIRWDAQLGMMTFGDFLPKRTESV